MDGSDFPVSQSLPYATSHSRVVGRKAGRRERDLSFGLNMNKYPKNQSELSDMAWSYRVGLSKMAQGGNRDAPEADRHGVADYFDYHKFRTSF